MLSVFAPRFYFETVPRFSKVRPEDIFLTIVGQKCLSANFCFRLGGGWIVNFGP